MNDLSFPCISSVYKWRRLIIPADVSGGGRGEAETKCYHSGLMGPGGNADWNITDVQWEEGLTVNRHSMLKQKYFTVDLEQGAFLRIWIFKDIHFFPRTGAHPAQGPTEGHIKKIMGYNSPLDDSVQKKVILWRGAQGPAYAAPDCIRLAFIHELQSIAAPSSRNRRRLPKSDYGKVHPGH